jgi:hypothetical protein
VLEVSYEAVWGDGYWKLARKRNLAGIMTVLRIHSCCSAVFEITVTDGGSLILSFFQKHFRSPNPATQLL